MDELNLKEKFYGITVTYELKAVHIVCDDALEKFLKNGKRKAAFKLAGMILHEYENQFKSKLKIKRHSLSVEIYDHFLLYKISIKIEKLIGKTRPTQWLLRHMDIIDCGEKEVDNNRFLWDMLSLYR